MENFKFPDEKAPDKKEKVDFENWRGYIDLPVGQKLKVDFSEEILRVMAHGVLHLCGYKD